MIQNLPLVLASASPRRMELLKGLGLKFTINVKAIDETFPPTMPSNEVALYIARKKAGVFDLDEYAPGGLITADTVVVLGDQIMGKPADEAEAMAVLGSLSGRTHEVVTGFCLRVGEEWYTDTDKAYVTIGDLTSEEIRHYVQTQPPLDKAGAYGIQDWLGLARVERLEGSYFTVMGLPTHKVYAALRQLGVLA